MHWFDLGGHSMYSLPWQKVVLMHSLRRSLIEKTAKRCGLSAFRKMFWSFNGPFADGGHSQMARRISPEKTCRSFRGCCHDIIMENMVAQCKGWKDSVLIGFDFFQGYDVMLSKVWLASLLSCWEWVILQAENKTQMSQLEQQIDELKGLSDTKTPHICS